jgi:hypothetical protein
MGQSSGWPGFESRNDEEEQRLCKKLARDPYFEPEMVTGKQWRIYYTWNMKMENRCLDVTFKNATPKVIVNLLFKT